jgi:hypothetical protein
MQPEHPQQEIRINGAEAMIGYSLQQCLSSLKNVSDPRAADDRWRPSDYFWIDAICINQDSTPEKNIQVSLMTTIYRQGRSLVVWLGIENDNADFVSRISSKSGLTGLCDSRRAWEALVAYAERPYWARLWIVQEFDSHRPDEAFFLCGQQLIGRKTVKRLYDAVLRPPRDAMKFFGTELSSREIEEHQKRISRSEMKQLESSYTYRMASSHSVATSILPDLLRKHRHRKCKDPRDKIYALLGLAYDQIPASLQPDYSKDVYTLFWDTINSSKMLSDVYLLLFESFDIHFKIAQNGISTSQHLLDNIEAQKEHGLLCPCVRLHNHGTVLQIAKHPTRSLSEHNPKHIEIQRNLDPGAAPGEKVVGCAIGDIEAGDCIYRITHVGIKLIIRTDPLMYVERGLHASTAPVICQLR